MAFRVGIVGLGVVSKTHLQALATLSDVQVTAVCDLDEKKRIDGKAFYTDFYEMAEKEPLDAVHICLPHYLHAPAAEAFAARGIHVLCEKPVALTPVEAAEMAQLEARYGVTVAVCLQNRWNRTFTTLQDLLSCEENGKLLSLKAIAAWNRPLEYYQAGSWRGKMAQAGGGCMMNQAVHTLDQLLLLGGAVHSVRGSICNLSGYPIEVEDTASAAITFCSGAKGLFFGSVCNGSNASIEIEAVCEKVTYWIKDYALWKSEPGSAERELIVRDDVLDDTKAYYGMGHRHLIRDFYRTLSGNGGHYVTVAEGAEVLKLISLIRESSEEKTCLEWRNTDNAAT